jgi:hypothetical protein
MTPAASEISDGNDVFDGQITAKDGGGFNLTSSFDDYAYRGQHLATWRVYDYYTYFYKERNLSGILFDKSHHQFKSHSQAVRKKTKIPIPNILGRFLFMKNDSEVDKDRDEY